MSHNVAVVSIEQVTTELGETAFQLSEVMGGRLVAGSLLYQVSLVGCYSPRASPLTFVKTALGFNE